MNTANLPDKLRILRNSLLTRLIERDTPIRLALLAALTGEHLLLIGPPGPAKSELARRLRHTFHGGTDVAEPLRRAVNRLQEAAWQRADILLVSDGEFPVPAETSAVLATVRREQKMKAHGLLVGRSFSPAMESLCDEVQRFGDWKLDTV